MTSVVAISAIKTDRALQARVHGLEGSVVYDYAEAMRTGAVFPPVDLIESPEGLLVADGNHRIAAAIEAGLKEILANIRQGTRRDALLLAAAANSKHGIRRNRFDTERAIEMLLDDAEWRQWSDRAIAQHVGCSHPTVSRVRARMTATGKLTSDSVRKTANGRTINTAGIGSRPRQPEAPAPAPPAPVESVETETVSVSTFAVGDKVITRAGKPGTVIGLSGRLVSVTTAPGQTNSHLPENLRHALESAESVESPPRPVAPETERPLSMSLEQILKKAPLPWSYHPTRDTIVDATGTDLMRVFWNQRLAPPLARMIIHLVNQAANNAGMTARADETVPAAGD